MNDQKPSRVELMLDLLAKEIEERMQARKEPAVDEEPPSPVKLPAAEVPGPLAIEPESVEVLAEPEVEAEKDRHPLEPEPEVPPLLSGPSHASRMMGRMALGLLVCAVLINVPLNRHGTTLATAMPDRRSVIIHEGLVVKEEDDPEIYVYQNGQFRWISSLDAFEHFGYTWGDVVIREDGFLGGFETGPPIHVLLKCPESPHIYRLEEGVKRWIRDIDTFEAEGHVWEDVRFVSCDYLRDLPDGETIPPDSGPPPQP